MKGAVRQETFGGFFGRSTPHFDGFQSIAGIGVGGEEIMRSSENPIKTGLKRISDPFKLVAGIGFEPMTFRL